MPTRTFRLSNKHGRNTPDCIEGTFGYVIGKIDQLGILYVHLVEASEDDIRHGGSMVPTDRLRLLFRRTLIVNGGYRRKREQRSHFRRTRSQPLRAFPFLRARAVMPGYRVG